MNWAVGPYKLEEQLGRGGMGVVHRAIHTETGLAVALKMMRPEPTTTDRHSVFLNELHQAAKLDHPNIAAIFDYGETTIEDASASEGAFGAHQPYIAMEYVNGPNLGAVLERAKQRGTTIPVDCPRNTSKASEHAGSST